MEMLILIVGQTSVALSLAMWMLMQKESKAFDLENKLLDHRAKILTMT